MRRVLAATVAATLAAVGIAFVVVVSSAARATAADASVTTVSASSGQLATSRDVAISRVTSHPEVVRRIDKIEAKLTTWGQYQANQGFVDKGRATNAPVWVVAVIGAITPATAEGRSFGWALFVLDSAGIQYLASANGPGSTWPAYFDALIDLAK